MNYHTLVLVHRILVSAFLFHYVWKSYLLISDKKETLANYTAKTRIAEMVISFGFLFSGIYLVAVGPAMSKLLWLKIAMVFASIPIAVVGFRKSKKMWAVAAVLLLIGAYGLAEVNKKHKTQVVIDTTTGQSPSEIGKLIYIQKCTPCHGATGDANIAGAKNLKTTTLTLEEQKNIIKNGKDAMPAFSSLNDEQIAGLVAYLNTLK